MCHQFEYNPVSLQEMAQDLISGDRHYIRQPSRKSDMEGLLVVSQHTLKNSMTTLKAGSLFEVESCVRKMNLKSLPCPCCNIQIHISGVEYFEVLILECKYNLLRMAWNKKAKWVKHPTYGHRYFKRSDDPMPVYRLIK